MFDSDFFRLKKFVLDLTSLLWLGNKTSEILPLSAFSARASILSSKPEIPYKRISRLPDRGLAELIALAEMPMGERSLLVSWPFEVGKDKISSSVLISVFLSTA